MPVFPSHAGIMPVTKKKAYYRLSSQVLLHPKLGSLDLKFGFKRFLVVQNFLNLVSSKIRILRSFRSMKGLKTFLVLRPQFFKTSRPSKSKNKTKILENDLRPVLRSSPVLKTTSLNSSLHSVDGAGKASGSGHRR